MKDKREIVKDTRERLLNFYEGLADGSWFGYEIIGLKRIGFKKFHMKPEGFIEKFHVTSEKRNSARGKYIEDYSVPELLDILCKYGKYPTVMNKRFLSKLLWDTLTENELILRF